MNIKLLLLTLTCLLASCATRPNFDTTHVDPSLTPQAVVTEPTASKQKTVLWGGTIIDTRNLKNTTQFEVLAYPLNSYHRPMLDSKPLGRFIVQHTGYLEPTTYAPGRLLSVLGNVTTLQTGTVGKSEYTYPVIDAKKIHLWSLQSGESNTSFHFGIGVRL